MRKFLVSPTVLKNLRYFIRPLYFSRTGWRAQRLVKNLPQQTTPFRNPADRNSSLTLSLFSRSNLSSFRKIDWKNSYRIFVANLYENSYRRNWNSFRLFLLLSTNISLDERRFRAEWINLVTNIFNKIGYSTKCWKNIKGFLIFFIDRSIYEKVVWWSIREISFLLWNILAAISILS